jgi:hypothetical protein
MKEKMDEIAVRKAAQFLVLKETAIAQQTSRIDESIRTKEDILAPQAQNLHMLQNICL